MNVTIKHVPMSEDGYSSYSAIAVEVDGVQVGSGSFGGEPEDNSELRDYGWVRPLIEQLAIKLGAEVVTVEVNDL